MPIQNRDDAVEVEERISRVFAVSPEQRAVDVRGLFVEVLDFNAASGQVSLTGATGSVHLPDVAERVAEMDGVHVLFIALPASDTDRVRKAEVDAAAKVLADQLGDDMLLVFTNPSATQIHVILPTFAGVRPTLRRMVLDRDLPRRTAIQQVSNIYWNYQASSSIRTALDQSFDVEPVTRDFFSEYKRIFEAAEQSVTGFPNTDAGKDNRRSFVQTLFNRLMFVYFLSRKGWLRFGGSSDYLNALWQDYGSLDGDHDFYTARLKPLFFAGLNNPQSQDLNRDNPVLYRAIGDVPFLNGGLFEQNELDRLENITVPNAAIEQVLSGLFDRFNFTVMESTPFDIEVAVDPEMLGKVFEELVTGRHDSGAYYTPRPVVSFMCREALKGYLEGQDTGLTSEAIASFVDAQETDSIQVAQARRIADALAQVTVVDPACGSGAYLLGMMQELIELQTALYNAGADAKALYDLKLEIIQRNLYGVDIDDFAVNIAMLRMWLSLAIDYEGEKPEPLPNLDFRVVCGDSLLGPDPSSGVEVQGTLGRDADRIKQLGQLKAEYLRAFDGSKKASLRQGIGELTEEIRQALGNVGVADGIMDWRVDFAEVLNSGRGFDIAIANPPYVQLQSNGGRLANLYRNAGYQTFARTGDIYQLFYERGCQVLTPSSGLLTYITSNSWLKAEYGKSTRRYFAENHTPLRLLELGKDVFESAIVDSGIMVARLGKSEETGRAVDLDRLTDKTFPPPEHLWGELRPDGEKPWSVLSAVERSVMDKMEVVGTPLKEWDISIFRGVTTGYNAAFVISTATKEALIAADPKSTEIIKPVLRGRDVQRYQAGWAGLWLIYSHQGIKIDDYPAIQSHLLPHKASLEKRTGGARRDQSGNVFVPYQWYELQADYYGSGRYLDFAKEKLFWMDLTENGRFAYDDKPDFCVNSAYMLCGASLKYLCAVLNSTLITWFMRNTALNSGMGVTRWVRFTVETIPIPKISEAEQDPFIELVDEILAAKSADPEADTEPLEWEIDRLVYDLYGLTEEEDTAVERSLGLIHATDEEEDAAILRAMLEGKEEAQAEGYASREEVMAILQELDGD